MGAPAGEFALTRNGTESLQNLILQYGKLTRGDAVMYADLDYDEMQQAMESLRHTRGATVHPLRDSRTGDHRQHPGGLRTAAEGGAGPR